MAMTPEQRQRIREQLRQRTQESVDRKDSFGGGNDIFKPGLKFKKFKAAVGENVIDILPFAAGNQMPTKIGYTAPGDWAINVDLMVHSNIGPDKVPFVCKRLSYGQECPICDSRDKLFTTIDALQAKADSGDTSVIKQIEELKQKAYSMRPSRRCIYYIIDQTTNKGVEEGIQVYDASHYSFQQHLDVLSKGRDGTVKIFYADDQEGKSISFTREGTGLTTKYLGHKFFDRDYVIDDKYMDVLQSTPLDELIHIPTTEEIKKALYGGSEEPITHTETATSAVGSTSRRETSIEAPAEAKPEVMSEPPFAEASSPPPTRRRTATAQPTEEPKPEPVIEEAAPAVVEPTPPPTRRRTVTAEPEAKPEAKPEVAMCPHGHPRTEIDKHPDCSNCAEEEWAICSEVAEQARKG